MLNFARAGGHCKGVGLINYAVRNYDSADRICRGRTVVDIYDVENLAIVVRANNQTGLVERGSIIGEEVKVRDLIHKLNLEDSVE